MESNHIYIPNLLELAGQVQQDSIISKILVKKPELEVTLFTFAKGQELNEHTSAYPAIIEILAGEGSMTLGKEGVRLQKGTWIYMESNLPHSLKADSLLVLLLTLRK